MQPQASQGPVCYLCGGAGASLCFTCRGTGTEDYTKFGNPYQYTDDKALESFYARNRHTCTSCGGSGRKKCMTRFGSGFLH